MTAALLSVQTGRTTPLGPEGVASAIVKTARTGFTGPKGRGTHELHGVMDRIDVLTGTLGKALGGASGGYTSGRKEIVEYLRQRSRPYLFSNTLAPPIVAGSLAVLRLLGGSTALRDRLEANTQRFRSAMAAAGFAIRPGVHPIVPIMLGEARVAVDVARRLLERGIYVIGFSYPVVPKGQARIRVQLSAAHSTDDVDRCVQAFTAVMLHVLTGVNEIAAANPERYGEHEQPRG